MLISEWMARCFTPEMAMTRSLLSKITDDKLNWVAGEGLHSIGWSANHLVDVAGWTPDVLQSGVFDLAPVDGPAHKTSEVSTIKEILTTYDENVAKSLKALQGVADSVLEEPWSLAMGGQVIFTMKKGECLHKWVFTHTAHHRGILSTYLRLSGLKFNSIYEE
jgi:uncharacterized damage-inducible protein DinB